jgi:ABC-type transport system substrate-binding protein
LGAALFTLTTIVAQAADPAKVLHVAFQIDVTGFDPQVASDGYSGWICRAIFDSLLEYDYLKRPYALKPSTAQALPEIRDGGHTLVFKLKPGIYFMPDPAFKGKPRELVALRSLDHFVRAQQQRLRHGESERLRGLQVDH